MRAIIPIVVLILGAASEASGRATTHPRDVLREVERAESAYRGRHGRYTASLSALRVQRPRGVDVRIVASGSAGYSAVAIADAEECAVYHGRARPPRHWVRAPDRIACRRS